MNTYCIYTKYSDTSTPYHTCSKILNKYSLLPNVSKKWLDEWLTGTDEMLHSAESHQGLHCLLWPVHPDIYGKYGILI